MYDFLLLTHFIGLALGVGTSFATLTLGLRMREMEPAARTQFFLHTSVLSKNGSIGLALLIASGLGMMAMRGVHETFVAGGSPFHLKLALVVVMIGLVGYLQVLIKRAREAGGGPTMAKIPGVGRLLLVFGLGVVTAAVLAFH